MNRHNFYGELPLLTNFTEITDQRKFSPVPNDWQIVITDVVNSTKAIEQGRYKEVNLIGATSIVAMLNLEPERQLPFVFGGDGATILIPHHLVSPARNALLAVQKIALDKFQLNLRVGIVPVQAVTNVYELRIAKLKISDNYHQAVFRGGALSYAGELVKQKNSPYQINSQQTNFSKSAVDLSGLECRWQDIPTPQEEILTLIVQACGTTTVSGDLVYRQVIAKITSIYGTEDQYCPVNQSSLNLTFANSKLILETKARCRGWWSEFIYLWQIKLENLLGWLLMKIGIKVGSMNWAQYKGLVITATDYKKFDDVLRLVIATTIHQRDELLDYLESQYQAGKLVYGFHLADRSLMTCLVFERHGQQVHFIDGADGGYTYAATALKQRLRRTILQK